MKQLTRQEVEAVVEIFADKTLSFGCLFMDDTGIQYIYDNKLPTGLVRTIIGHPITIGTVLEKIDKTVGGRNYYIGQTTYNDELIHLWSRCGELTQSLQEIIEESGWNEHVECNICGDPCSTICSNGATIRYEILQSPEANALFSFLQHLI